MHFRKIKLGLIFLVILIAACANDTTTSSPTIGNNLNSSNITTNLNQTPPESMPATKRPLDVPFVPTPEKIVDEMLQMAEVKGSDLLYDLGSGDGRIPITAAKRFGTRGVGIDLNPQRIKEANDNAEKAKVNDKVKFIEGDLFDQDLSEATVVTLYLLPEVNLKLRPKLWQLKPGTRVVSHNYGMGDWVPEKFKIVKTDDGTEHHIYFWRVAQQKQ